MHIKIAQFVVFLIVLGKRKVSAGLHIHFKKILWHINNPCKVREKSVQGA